MKFHPDRFVTDKNLSYLYLKILSIVVMLTATLIFIYFFITGNFHIHYIVSVGCLLLSIGGIFLWLISYLAETEKSIELTFEKTSKQVKRLGLLALGGFYTSGICIFVGLIFFAQTGDTWRYSIILFTGSALGLLICFYGLIQRKITKQHYELKKQQQEIIELLNEQRLKDIKDITSGALLA